MRHLIAAVAVAAPMLWSAPSFAQSQPSVDQIIRSLTPTGDVSRAGTRGIRLSAPVEAKAAATATGVKESPAVKMVAASQPAVAPTINLTVNFATGSAELTPQAVRMLDTLGAALSSDALSGYRFRIEGHTDTVGTREYNKALSERRAETVVGYIQQKYHVAGTRLEAAGMGQDQPLVPTAAQVDEPRNRRVQVTNIGS